MKRTRRAQSMAKWIFVATIGGVALAIAGVVIFQLSSPKVVVSEAVEGPVVQAFYSTGTIQPQREFPIKSNTAGIITEVKVDKGDTIKAGDLLAVVSNPELLYATQKAKAELEEKQKRAEAKTSPVIQEFDARITTNQALLDIAQREEQRIRTLLERNAASPTDLDTALDRLKTVWANLESFKAQRATRLLEMERELAVARSALDTANWNLEQQHLKAPIGGVVLDRPLTVGTRVAINDRVMTTADVTPARLVMRAAVDEEDVTKVRVEQTVRMTLYAYEDRTFEGKVLRIYPQADEARRTFEVDVQIVNPDDRFSSGMTGELAFIMASRDKALVIPSQAVQKGAVYTVENRRLKKLDVELGLRGIERTEVRNGLKPGVRIVISTIGDLEAGHRVRTNYTDPNTAAGYNKPKQVKDSFKGFN
ncbi:MAG: efflux RND transporter periplasmic adaptor subunit [Tepidisphaeraceae bacterium]